MASTTQIPEPGSKQPQPKKEKKGGLSLRTILELGLLVNSTVVALLVYLVFGYPSIHEQARIDAWNTLNSSIDQTGNGGRIIALQNLAAWQKGRKNLGWIPTRLADYLVGKEIDLRGLKADKAFLSKIKLKGADLNYASFSESKLWIGEFKDAEMKHVNFTGAILKGADLSRAKLGGANLTDADLSCFQIRDEKTENPLSCKPTDLSGADLSPDLKKNTRLKTASLVKANLSNANLESVDFTGANLIGANLENAKNYEKATWDRSLISLETNFPENYQPKTAYFLPAKVNEDGTIKITAEFKPRGTNFRSVNLSGINLKKVKLNNFDFTNAIMIESNLKEAKLENTKLVRVDLRGADLTNAKDLQNADFSYANLSGANLSNVHLKDANLSHANLSYADLSGTNLNEVKGLKTANLYRVLYTKEKNPTKFPNDDIPPHAIRID